MDTEKKFGLKKSKAILLFIQMFLVLILLGVSIYLLDFVTKNHLGAWMIVSYIFIILSVLSIIGYSVYGYKKGKLYYLLSALPFLVAILVNTIMPTRNSFQVALLTVLFSLTFAFLLRQEDEKFTYVISFLMVIVSLVFSIYSSITADTKFLGDISSNFPTYFAMYASIFIPTIMSATLALTYNVRNTRIK